MELVLTLLALPLCWFGLSRFNDNGSFGGSVSAKSLGAALLLAGCVCWMIALGNLRGVFAFLGLLVIMGLLQAYLTKPLPARN